MNIANALDLSGIKINLLSKLKPDLLLYLLPVNVYLVYINNNRKDNLSIDIRISRSSVLMGICLMILINILNPASIIAQELWSKEDLYNYLSMRNKAEFIEKFGIGSYIRKDIELTASDDALNKDELNYWIDNNRELSENNEYTDIFKDKNLIILQSESLSVNAINENITPNLFRLKNEGIFFSNFYAPLYPANTSDSEFIIQSSLIPSLNNGITCYEYGDNDFRENLPLLFEYIPLPPTYDGGREGGFNARPVIEEDGKKAWHLNFVFDLENLGPIEIKAEAKLPELKLSVVASTFNGLQKVQEALPTLKEKLQDLGITTRNATARMGKVHIREKNDRPVVEVRTKKDGSTFSVDI